MERGTLREDLYYRLRVFEIALAPLRERPDDVLPLAEAFLEEIGRSAGRPSADLGGRRDRLLDHPWPGNVRELPNAIERAVILRGGGLVASVHLPLAVLGRDADRDAGAGSDPAPALVSEVEGLDRIERDLLTKALTRTRNHKTKAAKLLGLRAGGSTRSCVVTASRRPALTASRGNHLMGAKGRRLATALHLYGREAGGSIAKY